MKLIKSLFGIKKTDELLEAGIKEKTYMVGYEIHTTDGARKKNMYQDVSVSDIEERAKTVKGEITEMMRRLEQAAKKNQTFVEIENNVYRVADVKSIVYIQTYTTPIS